MIGYKVVSATTSGWVICTKDDAKPEHRWCAINPLRMEAKYFKTREEILEYTISDKIQRVKPLLDQLFNR